MSIAPTTTRRRRVLAIAATAGLAGALAAAPSATAASGARAAAAPVTVNLTLTGPAGVIFDGDVTTDGHTVSPLTGGARLCDGTNLGANPAPGATPTAALDDAADANGFDWDGVWYASFEDYLVTSIDGFTQDADHFYEISVNGVATLVGGCQYVLDEGDEVAFTWTEFA
ncbi:DUF4430 domain-containing protein [Streptomyces hainanensis]|uniref:DUF4430 domain-containing protein n=1 Tax=Streptomyces hainanensis TaxID=402648 RepID=A0A4R4SL42_9ACTN|nr:DUF4430 domain-containing protein [Streptomyces hainanensis]TDC64417.1 DUF4430 domain-containing protein [Streptomyces hainanensis]